MAEKPLVPGMPLALSGHNGITSDRAHKEGLLELLRALCFDSTHTIMIFMLVVVRHVYTQCVLFFSHILHINSTLFCCEHLLSFVKLMEQWNGAVYIFFLQNEIYNLVVRKVERGL